MDVIELTNLNWQYFYKKNDIGKFKAEKLANFATIQKVA